MIECIRQNPVMRDQMKCSRCREKKIKCTRQAQQKCENCQKHNDAPCGPNYKKKDDPAYSGVRNEVIAHRKDSIQDAEGQPRVPDLRRSATGPNIAYVDQNNVNELSLVSGETNGQRKRKLASDTESDKLHENVNVLLAKLNSLGRSYEFASQLTPVSCRDRDNDRKYNKEPEDKMKAMRDESHLLFMSICQLGLQLHEQGISSDADGVFMKLMMALEKYPGLCDDRKIGALWNIAKFHLNMGDQDEHEWVLTKAAEVHCISVHQKDPCPPLVRSLAETSRRAGIELLELWGKHYMSPGETSLAIPPIQRSAQHRNAGIASELLCHSNSIEHVPPALFNQEGLHIAATRGNQQTLHELLNAGAQVDAPDVHNHTALFLAAAKGHEGCCAELIGWNADVNKRNIHGTTILEVAAGAGHVKVVQQLVIAGASVNPDFMCCTSSPLQAAIENSESPLEVALYLMGKEGDVSIRRKDGKNAIDLAEERCEFLAVIMRQKQQLGPQGIFDPAQPFYFNQTHLEFGLVPL